ncbi:MAG TPA: sulfatase-like hydrolase/transferase [Pyrinomonadaceae bacterium]|jgi:N-acetylglucosamine-6-sulfatase
MKMRILSLLVAHAVLMAALPAHGQARSPRQPTRPNIVFIISDDHRWDALGAAGNPQIKTPVLDKLAHDGVYFQQATIHISQCAPSRATLLTGLSPHQNGYYSNNFLRSDMQWADRFNVPTMPELLRQAGYQTVLVGKWHLATDPWLTGFSDVRTWLPEGASSYTDSRLARGNSRKKEVRKGFTNGIFADDAVEFLSSPAAQEKPFLLWLAATIPHAPYQPNPSHIEHLYEGEPVAGLRPPSFPQDATVDLALEGVSAGTVKPGLAKYYESVSYLDEIVGRVLATLEQKGLADNTIVVFLGDNGLMAGSRGVRGKVVPWEESVRVPLIIRAPKLAAAAHGRSDAPVSSLDIPATLLALAGVPRPKNWGGRDLRPLLEGSKRHGIDYAISEWADTESQFRNYTHRLIRTPRYKLVRWDKPDKPDELYDLMADPHEMKNLAAEPSMRSVRDELLRRLQTWMERTNDPARFWAKKNGKTQDQREAARAESELRAGLEDKTPSAVDPRTYDAYVGRYEFATRAAISISKEDNRLFFTGELGGKSELIPKAENVFLHKTLPMRLTFLKDEKGRVTHLVRRHTLSADVLTIDMRARKIE